MFTGFNSLWEAFLVVVVWVALWGLLEMFVDKVVDGNLAQRAVVYFVMLLLALAFLWIFVYSPAVATAAVAASTFHEKNNVKLEKQRHSRR